MPDMIPIPKVNIDLKKPRKSPIPADAKRIKEGALRLPLKDKVDLRNALTTAIESELKEMTESLKQATDLVNKHQ